MHKNDEQFVGLTNRWAAEALTSGTTFKQSVILGEASLTDIDDWVDVWHESKGPVPLSDFLGFSAAEYALWVKQPSALHSIVKG